jgi:O-antigen ligase
MVFLDILRSHQLTVRLGKLVPTQVWQIRPSLLFSLCTVTFVSSLLLGGGTRGGFLSDAILQLLAIPAFLLSLFAVMTAPGTGRRRPVEWALVLCLAIGLLPLLQLVPLPPLIWERLPNREDLVAVYNLVGRGPSWLPVSLAPNATWLSVLSLLPPIAVFLCMIQLSYRERRMLCLIFLGVGAIAAMLGLIQAAQGPSSPLRFFVFTNEYEPVGFFANRNHFAALLYMLLLFAAAWATEMAFSAGSWRDLRSLETSTIAGLTAIFLLLVILIVVETITRSRAGLGLMIVGMFCAFALPVSDRRWKSGDRPTKLIAGAIAVVMLLAAQLALYRMLDRFAVDPVEGARLVFARNTFTAALAYMPFGSGFGTFVSVYPMFEQASDTLANVYANHAHNDVIEVCLEGGVAAIGLMIAFVIWLALRSKKIWWHASMGARTIDILIARAATIAVVLIILHSFVDYPLRTDAMMAVFAFACALLIEPIQGSESTISPDAANERLSGHEERTPPWKTPSGADSVPTSAPSPSSATSRRLNQSPPATRKEGERWGEDVAWPTEWSTSNGEGPRAKKPID